MITVHDISVNRFLALIAFLVATVAVLAVPMEFYAGMILIITALLFLLRLYSDNGRLAFILFVALLLRSGLVYLDQIFSFLPDQPDQVLYNNQAIEILQSWRSGMYPLEITNYARGTSPYSYFLAVLYLPFDFMPLLGRLANVIVSIICVYCFYIMIREVTEDEAVAMKSTLILAFLPSFIVFNSYILRDTLLIMLSFFILLSVIKISKRQHSVYYALLFIGSFIVAGLLREQNIYLFSGFFLLFLLFRALFSKIQWKTKILLILFSVLVPILFYLYSSTSFLSVATYFFRAQPLRAEGGSAYLTNMQYQTFFDIIKFLPIRFFYFCFGPFLWQIHGPVQLITALEGMFFLAMALFSLFYFWMARGEKHAWLQYLVIGFALTGLLANATVDSNFGTAVRHKLNYIVLLIPFALMFLKRIRVKW